MIQQSQISTYSKKFTKNINTIKNFIINDNDELSISDDEDKIIPIFSRITNDSNISKCNFCNKPPHYQDMENKLYCWFHRSQFEE